ncbi:hypothetical protein [Qipengyuania sp. R86523]|uniref:hypothetical protein n=1 Tax=Qipengyuania sp. R86523 TaxID=3093862 RepID=UPI0037C55C16
MSLDQNQQKQLLALKSVVLDKFTPGNWTELGMLTGCVEEVRKHPRLIRSLGWGDPDYEEHALSMLLLMAGRDPANMAIIEDYVLGKGDGITLPSLDGGKKVLFKPSVFEVPDAPVDSSLVAVMMPFDSAFVGTHAAISRACTDAGMKCQRVDDLWEHATVIQDVFSLIWRASIVVCDFSGRNANVFYECGIAHTLGKPVVPITQHKSDVPFDLQHHRYLQYLNNVEGLARLQQELAKRLRTLAGTSHSFGFG